MELTLLGLRDSCRSQKAMLAAEMAGVTLNVPAFNPDTDAKTPAFKAKSPLGRTPVLETPNGCIVGSVAAARYIARLRPEAELYGRSFHEQGEIDMWIEMGQNELEVPLSAWVYPALGLTEANEDAIERAKTDVNVALGCLNEHLLKNTYLVGDRLSLADICLVTPLVEAYRAVFDDAIKAKWQALFRWFHTCVNHPAFVRVFGPVYTPNTKMSMDKWKTTYSNTKDLRGTAMTWFWKNYMPEGNSLWYMKYNKLEDECKVAFVTSNQLNGFLQRFDPAFRKASFGVIDIVGVDGDYDIQGVWCVEGDKLPTAVTEHPSYEYHEWRKLDHTKEADKKLVEDYWCENDNVDNRPIADCKVWK